MAAYAVFFLLTRIPKQRLRTVVSLIIIIGLTFFMTTSTISNLDSPLWLKESTISTSYTVQELKGAETLSLYSAVNIFDLRWNVYMPRVGNIFVWTTYLEDRPIRMYIQITGYYAPIQKGGILGQEFFKGLVKMQNVYANGDVAGYFIQTVT